MTDEEFADLSERVQQIHELTQHRGWDLLIDRASADLGKRQERILTGRLEPTDYQHETGIREGMLLVFRLPILVREEFETVARDREEARQVEEFVA